jgi:hypothetical protein
MVGALPVLQACAWCYCSITEAAKDREVSLVTTASISWLSTELSHLVKLKTILDVNTPKHLLLAALLTLVAQANANLVTNSSFEVNTNAGAQNGANDTADGWNVFSPPNSFQSTPDVWDNAGSFGVAPGYFGHFTGVTAFGGTKFATIGSFPGQPFFEGIESSAFALNASQTYRVGSYMLYDQFGAGVFKNPAPITVRLRQNNAAASFVVGTLSSNSLANTWQNRTLDFSVKSTDSYTLIFSNEAGVNSYIALDLCTVEVVPEPATVTALLAGSALLARRRSKRAQ